MLDRYLDLIHDGLKRIERTVANLLDFSRQRRMVLEPTSINHNLRHVLELVEYQLRAGAGRGRAGPRPGRALRHGRPLPDGAAVPQPRAQRPAGDARGRHADADGRAPGRARSSPRCATPACGIPEEMRDRIFDPFFTTRDVDEGTGLGLTVSDSIVASHGGTLEVESTPGKGSVFRVSFPALRPVERAEKSPMTVCGRRRLLIVEDEPLLRVAISDALRKEGWIVDVAEDGVEGRRALREAPARRGAHRSGHAAHGRHGAAAQDQGPGARDHRGDDHGPRVGGSRRGSDAQRRGGLHRQAVFHGPADGPPGKRLLGSASCASRTCGCRSSWRSGTRSPRSSARARRCSSVFDLIQVVADSDASVLVHGESGTGKEMVANAIHYNSPRRAKPYLKVSCASLPETLIESELFGYEKGAFTGASQRRIGRFEAASGGTLFLDEISELPLTFQVKLLRVLQERQIERLGSNRPIDVDVRIVSASLRPLEEEIARRALPRGPLLPRSTPSRSTFPRCAIGGRTSRCWPRPSCRSSAANGASRSRASATTSLDLFDALPLAGQRARTAQRGRARGAVLPRPADHRGGTARPAARRRAEGARRRNRPRGRCSRCSRRRRRPRSRRSAPPLRASGGRRTEAAEQPGHQPQDALGEDQELRDRRRELNSLRSRPVLATETLRSSNRPVTAALHARSQTVRPSRMVRETRCTERSQRKVGS